MLNVVYALMASEADGLVNHAEVRDRIDAVLEDLATELDPDTWGMSERATANLRAAEAMFGP